MLGKVPKVPRLDAAATPCSGAEFRQTHALLRLGKEVEREPDHFANALWVIMIGSDLVKLLFSIESFSTHTADMLSQNVH